ncbi:DUF535 domain-containing protein [Erwinia sp. S43]|uniref:VirK/YbjX family protein n=1 Tax=unclassified Erwinia TaxID=2622719 RepID=UPI00190B6CAE|nr:MULTISPECIES: VirK/YbjX family protein [unclassified Erwinia]MBK0033192.1 DUF535 domain-containing protein [Erwinia sp. S43]MCW1875084.1 VirK/YbjX family protein [Erwinia sp. INIA01]
MSHQDDVIMLPLPLSPWKLCLSLFQGKHIPHELWNSKKFRHKFLARSLLMPFTTHKLLKLLTGHPSYEKLLLAQPRLPCRLHRPYLTSILSRQDGLEAILYHYTVMQTVVTPDVFNRHLDNSLCIAEFETKYAESFRLNFVSTHKLDREGESSLILSDGAGDLLCSVTFTLIECDGVRGMMVGGLQGPNGESAQERIQRATKNLHGMFPKRLVFEFLLSIAQRFKVKTVLAVSNRTHVYQSLRYRNRKKHMHADYDEFWETSGGYPSFDDYYLLPTSTHRKALEDIPSKKRSEYRKRYQLLDDISAQIDRQLSSNRCI